MVMLSALRRHRLVDSRGHSARVTDVAVDLSVGDYPLVTRVLYRHKGHGAMAIPWATAASGSSQRPPSENESGVTFRTPMTKGRGTREQATGGFGRFRRPPAEFWCSPRRG